MYRRVIETFTLFFLFLTPFCLADQIKRITITADSISVKPENILHAKGNVKVQRGDVFIRADAMTVNEAKNQIKFDDIIEFSDGKSLRIAGDSAILSDDLSAGIINAAQVLIDDTVRIRSEEIKLKNSTVERAENIDRITSCEECESGFPLWHFS